MTEDTSPTTFSPCVEIDALWQMLDMGKCGADDQRCVARWLVDLHREHAASVGRNAKRHDNADWHGPKG